MERMLTLSQSADSLGISTQALYLAIRKGRIPTVLVDEKNRSFSQRKYIKWGDLIEYRKNRYNRELREKNGKLIFDHEKGLYSPKQLAEATGKPLQRIYYLMRMKFLKYSRNGCSYVIDIKDFEKIEVDGKGR